MFTFYIYQHYLNPADDFWNANHIASLWGIGLFMDVLLVLVLAVMVLSAMALSQKHYADAMMRLGGLANAMEKIDRVMIWLGFIALTLLVLVTFVSVVGRTTIGQSVPDDISFAEWAMVALVALVLGTIQGRGEHIEVTVVSDMLSERGRLVLRLLGVAIGVIAIGRLAMVSLDKVPDSFLELTYGSIYDLPLWPPRLIFMLGTCWWLARIAIQVLLLPMVIKTQAQADLSEYDWVLTPLLPEDSGHEIEDSGEFAILPTGGGEK